MNTIKTMVLMVILTLLLLLLGGAIAGEAGVIFAFVLALAINFFAYWYSDRLAITMTGSRPLQEGELPQVEQALDELVREAQMPRPRLYVMPTDQPNAFAAGRNPQHAVIAVTRGLVRILNYEEMKGVLAHELGHIHNRDVLISTIAAVLAGALMFIARFGMYGMMFGGGGQRGGHPAVLLVRLAALVLAPLGALLIRMAISRTREYQADATGAFLARNNQGLASALEKMEAYARQRPLQVNEATSHMFIVNPLSGRGLGALFSTHPPLRERVRRLRNQYVA